jgi:hypothetical protein
MKKNLLLHIVAIGALLTACDYNELNFEGLDDKAVVTDIKKIEYTLTDADYATIGSNSTNKALAEELGQATQLANLKTTKYFTDEFTAANYVPAFAASKWFTADNKSAVKITYNKNVGRATYLASYENRVRIFSTDDYKSVSTNVGIAKTFYPSYPADTHVPVVLKQSYPAAVSGDICLAYYNTTNTEPVVGQATLYEEKFETGIGQFKAISVKGDQVWVHDATNKYMKMTGYVNSTTRIENEDWLISPQIDLTGQTNSAVKIKQVARFFSSWDEMTLNVSTDFDGTNIETATWTKLTITTLPTGTNWNFVESEDIDLSAYDGKKIYVGFKYLSSTTTAATWEINGFKILTKGLSTTGVEEKGTYYKYSGSKWEAISNGVVALGSADYLAMGIAAKNFSSSALPENYLPKFLSIRYPYAQADAKMVVGYKYYSSSTKTTSYIADEYNFTNGSWTKLGVLTTSTDQFVKANNKWVWDPSVVIDLVPVRNNALSMKYYQAATDWVWENIDVAQLGLTTKGKGYVSSFGNNEYYTGCSAYYNNIDMRPSAARAQYGTEYNSLTDAEVIALMTDRLKVVLGHALEKVNPDVMPIDGVEITYTLNVAIYTGTAVSKVNNSLVYKVTGPGTFEYVSGPTLIP